MGLTLKGDTDLFTSVVNVNTEYEQKGSFSTIYVMNMEKSTVLQNWIVAGRGDCETWEISSSSSHMNDQEDYTAGKIQYNSSIGNALVLAYTEAAKKDSNIHLSYKFVGFDVTYYYKESLFRVGDRIYGANLQEYGEISVDKDPNEFREVLPKVSKKSGDLFYVKRGDSKITIPVNEKNKCTSYGIFECNPLKSYPTYSLGSNFIGGPSGGLLQTLSIYNQLVEEDLTHGLRIAGTGTISISGTVGAIGGIKEKVPTAFDDNMDVFFCVKANYEEALEAYNQLPNKDMKLIEIETFYDALNYLKEGYKNDFGNKE